MQGGIIYVLPCEGGSICLLKKYFFTFAPCFNHFMYKIMSKFDLYAMGVTELIPNEMKAVNGGSVIGWIVVGVVAAIAAYVAYKSATTLFMFFIYGLKDKYSLIRINDTFVKKLS